MGADRRGRRVARELHDKVAHSLGVALNSLELHEVYLEQDPPRARRELRNATHAVRGALKQVRDLSADLRGHEVRDGLERALDEYLNTVAPPAISCSVTVTGDDPALAADLRDELYLILREAARNALIHAAARHLAIRVDIGTDDVHATVTDDGHGFDPRGQKDTGGLASMLERAELLGGTLTLSSDPRTGTIVQVHVPVRSANIAPDQQ